LELLRVRAVRAKLMAEVDLTSGNIDICGVWRHWTATSGLPPASAGGHRTSFEVLHLESENLKRDKKGECAIQLLFLSERTQFDRLPWPANVFWQNPNSSLVLADLAGCGRGVKLNCLCRIKHRASIPPTARAQTTH
jgi:hypothetical protein